MQDVIEDKGIPLKKRHHDTMLALWTGDGQIKWVDFLSAMVAIGFGV